MTTAIVSTTEKIAPLLRDGRWRTTGEIADRTGEGKWRVARALGRLREIGLLERRDHLGTGIAMWRRVKG